MSQFSLCKMQAIGAAAAGMAVLLLPSSGLGMELCSDARRVSCVVDGDTVWIKGEKIRLADVDAPEPEGRCVDERLLAARSAGRLAELLEPGDYTIHRAGKDTYGRTLAIIIVGGVSVGTILADEGLARPWTGRREGWC